MGDDAVLLTEEVRLPQGRAAADEERRLEMPRRNTAISTPQGLQLPMVPRRNSVVGPPRRNHAITHEPFCHACVARARRAAPAPISLTNLRRVVLAFAQVLGGAADSYAQTRMQGRRLILRLSYTQIYTASRFVGGRTAFRCCRPVWLRTGSGAS